jgi:hypothetical protein
VGEFFALLGFDTHDYEGERVIKEHSTDSEIGEELSDMVKILTVNSTDIPEFKGTKEAVELCRDSVLNSMYSRNFAKYAGNPDVDKLLKTAAKQVEDGGFDATVPDKIRAEVVKLMKKYQR